HHPPAGFQHIALEAAQIEATAGRRFVLDPQRRCQVEGQQRQPQQGCVGLKIVMRKMRPNGLLKLAEAVLERSPLTVMGQRRGSVELLRLPARYGKENSQQTSSVAPFADRADRRSP